MARQNNPRKLRSSLWSNPMFCLYCAKNEDLGSWTKRLYGANSTFSFMNKIYLKKKKNKKKKELSLLKLTRSIVLCSSYSNTIMPLLSKAATMQVQFQLNKLKTSYSGKAYSKKLRPKGRLKVR